MARSRRSSGGRSGGANPAAAAKNGGGAKGNAGGKSGKNGKGRNNGGSNGASGGAKTPSVRDFWGTHLPVPEPVASVRPADNPAAVVKSLGPPPLTGHEVIAEHYFAAVYEKAAKSASALAAASGLLDFDSGS
jgi:hypothetical protein